MTNERRRTWQPSPPRRRARGWGGHPSYADEPQAACRPDLDRRTEHAPIPSGTARHSGRKPRLGTTRTQRQTRRESWPRRCPGSWLSGSATGLGQCGFRPPQAPSNSPGFGSRCGTAKDARNTPPGARRAGVDRPAPRPVTASPDRHGGTIPAEGTRAPDAGPHPRSPATGYAGRCRGGRRAVRGPGARWPPNHQTPGADRGSGASEPVPRPPEIWRGKRQAARCWKPWPNCG